MEPAHFKVSSNDMSCEINMYADEENKVYTVEYTFHSDKALYHSETTLIFHSMHQACVYLQALRKKCVTNHIPFEEMIEVI